MYSAIDRNDGKFAEFWFRNPIARFAEAPDDKGDSAMAIERFSGLQPTGRCWSTR